MLNYYIISNEKKIENRVKHNSLLKFNENNMVYIKKIRQFDLLVLFQKWFKSITIKCVQCSIDFLNIKTIHILLEDLKSRT